MVWWRPATSRWVASPRWPPRSRDRLVDGLVGRIIFGPNYVPGLITSTLGAAALTAVFTRSQQHSYASGESAVVGFGVLALLVRGRRRAGNSAKLPGSAGQATVSSAQTTLPSARSSVPQRVESCSTMAIPRPPNVVAFSSRRSGRVRLMSRTAMRTGGFALLQPDFECGAGVLDGVGREF